jgi:hypothetical protein
MQDTIYGAYLNKREVIIGNEDAEKIFDNGKKT